MNEKEWFENDKFWEYYAPVMFDENRWSEAPGVADRVIKLCSLKEGDTLLDAGCGPGRISVELAINGINVTGVDIIQSELDAAKDSADDEGVTLELINCDLRRWKTDKKYDAAINLYTSFGYCDTIEEDTLILKNIYDSLKDGGKFVLECTSRESAILFFTEGEWFTRQNLTVLTEFSVVGAWEGLKSRWIIIDDKGERHEHCFVQRLYSASELKKTLLELGYKECDIYGDYDKNPYDNTLRTMVLVATK